MPSLVTAALVAVLLDPTVEPVAVALDWHAPEGCPQRDAIAARLAKLLPEVIELRSGDAPAQLRVRGSIEAGFEVGLRFESERGVDEREFSGSDCVVLADAAALVIAVAVDPVAVSQTITLAEDAHEDAHEDEPAPLSSPAPPPPSLAPEIAGSPTQTLEVGPAPIDLVAGDDDEQLGPRFSFALLGGGGYGPLRLAQAAVGLELGVLGRRWRASVRGSWLPPRRQSFASGDAARFDGFAIAARGCGVPSAGPLEFPICAGVEAGALRGRGSGPTADPRDANIPWAAVIVGPGLRWPVIDRIALGVDLELLAPVVRGGFTIDDVVVQQLGPVGVQALAAVELRLP